MRVTIYLPDELGRAGKAAGVNFSGLLRGAVERELRGEEPEGAQRVHRAVVSARQVPGGVELVLFLPEDALPEPEA